MGQPVKIIVTSGAEPGRVIEVERELVLGRVLPADIVIVDPRVSGRHAILRPGPRGIVIEDAGSSNGTFVNGVQVTTAVELVGGEAVQVGDTKLTVQGAAASAQPTALGDTTGWQLVVRTGPDSGLRRPLGEGQQLVIGRDQSAQIALTDSRVSNHHAAVQLSQGHATIRDLGSANGTLLNGSPVTGPTSIHSGSEIQVGETVIVATMGAAPTGGPTPTVIGTVPKELGEQPKRSRRTLVGATLASALIVAGGVTAGAFVLTRDDDTALTPAEIVKANRNATVLILSKQDGELRSSGSGFVVDATQGLIVTNNHVATGGDLEVQPEVDRKTRAPAKIVAALPCEDLALIQVDDKDLRAKLGQVTFAERPFVQGDKVVALGYPGSAESGQDFGKDSLSATDGIVSKVDIKYDVPGSGVPLLTSAVQHTAAVNPGNSGGPLFDDAAELIGVNTAIFSRNGQRTEGENYAVSVKRLTERLQGLKQGKAEKWTGISFGQTITSEAGEPLGLTIEGVSPGSPADDANVPVPSVLVEIDGTRVSDLHDYCDVVPSKEGDGVALKVAQFDQSGSLLGIVDIDVKVGTDG